MLFDWLITGRVLPTNPAAAVRGAETCGEDRPNQFVGPDREPALNNRLHARSDWGEDRSDAVLHDISIG